MKVPKVNNEAYKTAFVIPIGTSKVLEDDGWEFEGNGRLSPKLVDSIAAKFGLIKAHTYSGIVVYSGSSLKMSVVLDDSGEIEHLSIQIFTGDVENVQADLLAITRDLADVFVPSLR